MLCRIEHGLVHNKQGLVHDREGEGKGAELFFWLDTNGLAQLRLGCLAVRLGH